MLRANTNNKRPVLLNALTAMALALPLGAQAQIDIVFDYSYDSGFFADAGRKAILEQAASDIEARLVNETFGAITPNAVNHWTLSFDNPGHSGTEVSLTDRPVLANTLTLFVGGSSLGSGGPLAFANFGLSIGGTGAWTALFNSRNSTTNYDPVGGGITFNTSFNWYFGSSEAGQSFAQYDFYSVAAHEIFHILGFGQGNAYNADVSADGKTYTGAHVQAVAGQAVELDWVNGDPAHWDQGVLFQGKSPAMVPALVNGQRNNPSELDYAVLRDIGYNVTAPVPEPATWLMAVLGLAAVGTRWRRKA
ncbi:PEP-CTERM motif protein [Burkholderiales bacterium JOSHI_001]|nr:PEP-CTERM motif protein [Burkholderiales bacterium JOSHI_001]